MGSPVQTEHVGEAFAAAGRALAARRREAGLTQSEYASRLGLAQHNLNRLETGEPIPTSVLAVLDRYLAEHAGDPVAGALRDALAAQSREPVQDRGEPETAPVRRRLIGSMPEPAPRPRPVSRLDAGAPPALKPADAERPSLLLTPARNRVVAAYAPAPERRSSRAPAPASPKPAAKRRAAVPPAAPAPVAAPAPAPPAAPAPVAAPAPAPVAAPAPPVAAPAPPVARPPARPSTPAPPVRRRAIIAGAILAGLLGALAIALLLPGADRSPREATAPAPAPTATATPAPAGPDPVEERLAARDASEGAGRAEAKALAVARRAERRRVAALESVPEPVATPTPVPTVTPPPAAAQPIQETPSQDRRETPSKPERDRPADDPPGRTPPADPLVP